MVKYEVEGSGQLQKAFANLGQRGVMAALRGVKITAIEVLNAAKQRLASGGQRVTSKLFNNGKVVASEAKEECEVVFGDAGKEVAYAYYVEFGRRAGKMPPLEYITEWVVKKGLADTHNIKSQKRAKRDKAFDYRAMSIAFLIAKSIAKKGTKAKPFLFPAFEEKRNNIIKNIETELGKEIAALTK